MSSDSKSPNPWLALLGVCFGVFMFTLDGSIVNIAVPTLIRELDASLTQVQWVIQAYLLVVVLLLMPVAHFSGRIGQKRIFLTGIALFTIGSALCGTAGNIEFLIGFRMIQAVGAVGMAALMSSIVAASFPKEQLGQALGLVTATATLGTSLGPTIGGFLIDASSWHLIFLVNLPTGIVAFTLVSYGIPKEANDAPTSTVALGEYLSLFRSINFSIGITARFLSMFANAAFLFLTPILLEAVLHYNVSKAGLLLAVAPILIGISSPLFGGIADRFGRIPFLFLGQAIMVAGVLAMGTFSATTTELEFIFKAAIWGLGVGIFNAPNSAVLMSNAPPKLSDAVSALISLAIILGQFAGVAVGGTLFHFLAFRTVPGTDQSILSLAPADTAAAIAETLGLFAIPLGLLFLVGLANRLFLRRKPAASGSN